MVSTMVSGLHCCEVCGPASSRCQQVLSCNAEVQIVRMLAHPA